MPAAVVQDGPSQKSRIDEHHGSSSVLRVAWAWFVTAKLKNPESTNIVGFTVGWAEVGCFFEPILALSRQNPESTNIVGKRPQSRGLSAQPRRT